MNEETITKEDRIIEHLDEGGALTLALSKTNADHTDVRMYRSLYDMKDDTVDIPTTTAFRAMLGRLAQADEKKVASPYAPVRSPFAVLKFFVPITLGLFIIISGFGLETGRVAFDENMVPDVQIAVQKTNPALVQVGQNDGTPLSSTEVSTLEVALGSEVETDYDALIAEENETFTSLSYVYDVTV